MFLLRHQIQEQISMRWRLVGCEANHNWSDHRELLVAEDQLSVVARQVRH